MTKKRTLIVGDVHGCFDELSDLLKKTNYQKDFDRLIFLGDLINKGPKSLDVLEWVKESGAEVILGNHELGFLNFLEDPNPKFSSFTKLQAELGSSLSTYVSWIKSFPLYIEEEDFIAVHAGIVPGMELSSTPAHLITRIRTWDGLGENLYNDQDPAWYDLYDGKKLVVYGHWAGQGLKIRANTIGLDSGCCWGWKLSLLHLEKREIFQVDAKEAYAEF